MKNIIGEEEKWAMPRVDFGILDEARDPFSQSVLEFVMVSRARTTREERRAIVESVKRSSLLDHEALREAVRHELVARGLFPADWPLAAEEIEEADDVDMDRVAARAREFLGIPTPKPGEPIQWPSEKRREVDRPFAATHYSKSISRDKMRSR